MEISEKGLGKFSGEVGSQADITRVMRAGRGEKEEVKFREEVGREEEEKERVFARERRNKRGMLGGESSRRGT